MRDRRSMHTAARLFARAHLATTNGPRSVLGSQRVQWRRRLGMDSGLQSRWWPLRAEDGSRSVPFGWPRAIVGVVRCALFVLVTELVAHAQIQMPPQFSHNMVLQRGAENRIWGKAAS